jgi:hypothetical protein
MDSINAYDFPAATFYYYITARDDLPNEYESAPSDYIGKSWLLKPSSPAGFAASAGDQKVNLSWNANPEENIDGYNIYRSTNPMQEGPPCINAGLVDDIAYEDSSLVNGTTYYYRITAINSYALESGYSDEVYALPKDSMELFQVLGIKSNLMEDSNPGTPADLNYKDTGMKLSWSQVTKNKDGTTCNDLKGYVIYRSTSIEGVFSRVAFVEGWENSFWTGEENHGEELYYYMIKALDTSGNLSEDSMILDSSENSNVIVTIDNDKTVSLFAPRMVNSIFYKDVNSYKEDIRIEIQRNRQDEAGDIIMSYTFLAKKGETDEIIKDFVFEKPLVEINIPYRIEDGAVRCLRYNIPENKAADSLALYWYNGVQWIKLGGNVDSRNHVLSVKTRRIGKYAIKPAMAAVSFGIESIYPDKIFSPNGDGWNDYFEIQYANPQNACLSGKIYDVKSRFVADMEAGLNGNSFTWDGRDNNGNYVSGGVYIYQLKSSGAEEKVLNGTCVVVR